LSITFISLLKADSLLIFTFDFTLGIEKESEKTIKHIYCYTTIVCHKKGYYLRLKNIENITTLVFIIIMWYFVVEGSINGKGT
jgi:hypothetical protein